MNRWKKDQAPKPSRFEDTKGETETFATRNVRLITFLVCIGVFLAVFIPIGVVGISQYRDWFEYILIQTSGFQLKFLTTLSFQKTMELDLS